MLVQNHKDRLSTFFWPYSVHNAVSKQSYVPCSKITTAVSVLCLSKFPYSREMYFIFTLNPTIKPGLCYDRQDHREHSLLYEGVYILQIETGPNRPCGSAEKRKKKHRNPLSNVANLHSFEENRVCV